LIGRHGAKPAAPTPDFITASAMATTHVLH
jgi:hypothetical protein